AAQQQEQYRRDTPVTLGGTANGAHGGWQVPGARHVSEQQQQQAAQSQASRGAVPIFERPRFSFKELCCLLW
ncbi:mitogen-activated protein kinase kinase kinase, partial [Friedmanniomyces endolithicus]